MGLLEDTFKFSTGGNYYGTGGSYYGDQEKKKRDFYSKYKRQDIQPITPKKSLEQIAKESQYGKPTGVLPPNISTLGQSQGRTSDGMDLGKWHGNNAQDQQSWWQKLAGKAGIDYKTAQATWNKKGGFEGLMANPAFTMGLAFMQAGAEGKTLGQGALDNVMKAAGISSHYKKILKDRKQEPIQATAQDVDEVKGLLKSIGVEEGNIFEKVWSKVTGQGNQQVKFDLAAEEIAVQFQKEVRDWQANNKYPDGTAKIIRSDDKIRILKKLIKDKKVKFKESWLSKIGLTAATVEKEYPKLSSKAQGGPVAKGQPYVVGEGGPEYFLPKESGKILSNDDSRIFAMLLAANPQLQNVSRTRAEKILRNRFPEYFD